MGSASLSLISFVGVIIVSQSVGAMKPPMTTSGLLSYEPEPMSRQLQPVPTSMMLPRSIYDKFADLGSALIERGSIVTLITNILFWFTSIFTKRVFAWVVPGIV